MKRVSHDAAKILALPAARHPRLSALVQALSENVSCDLGNAEAIINGAMRDARITPLDLEMLHPANVVRVPFLATTNNTPQQDFQAGIQHHIHLIENGLRR